MGCSCGVGGASAPTPSVRYYRFDRSIDPTCPMALTREDTTSIPVRLSKRMVPLRRRHAATWACTCTGKKKKKTTVRKGGGNHTGEALL